MNDKDRELFDYLMQRYKGDVTVAYNVFRAALDYARKEQCELLEMAAGALKQVDDIVENQALSENDKGWRIATVIAPIRLTLQQHGYGKD